MFSSDYAFFCWQLVASAAEVDSPAATPKLRQRLLADRANLPRWPIRDAPGTNPAQLFAVCPGCQEPKVNFQAAIGGARFSSDKVTVFFLLRNTLFSIGFRCYAH
jgi:hypothetical protein